MRQEFKEKVTSEMGRQARNEKSDMIWVINVAGDILQRTFST